MLKECACVSGVGWDVLHLQGVHHLRHHVIQLLHQSEIRLTSAGEGGGIISIPEQRHTHECALFEQGGELILRIVDVLSGKEEVEGCGGSWMVVNDSDRFSSEDLVSADSLHLLSYHEAVNSNQFSPILISIAVIPLYLFTYWDHWPALCSIEEVETLTALRAMHGVCWL